MRFSRKVLKTDKKISEKLLSQGWKQIKEPKTLLSAILMSVPFMIINLFFTIGIILGLLNLLNGFTIFLLVLNAMASSVDSLNFVNIIFQVPKDAIIVSNGTDTFFYNEDWKLERSTNA